MAETDQRAEIARLNDSFRKSTVVKLGQVVLTQGIVALDEQTRLEIINRVKSFDDFNADNDPHGEHDFGSFDHNGEKVFWKIDCYDRDMKYGSSDPSDEAVTTRVLTIMLASEY